MNPFKRRLLFLVYIWLRFDPMIRLAFGKNWTPRYEFLASFFGEEDTRRYLAARKIKIEKVRNKKPAPVVQPSQVDKQIGRFLQQSPNSKVGREKRVDMIKTLVHWALDSDINQQNVDSYKTRSAIIDAMLGPIFQNSLANEVALVLDGLKKIVFSRVTYMGSKGEPSPVVHDTIIANVGRILNSHFDEVAAIRERKLEELTKIKLIKEIKKDQENKGSLPFSATHKKSDPYHHKFPLPDETTQLLLEILKHYRYSAWPESRKTTKELIAKMEKRLGFSLEESLHRWVSAYFNQWLPKSTILYNMCGYK